MGNKIHPTAIVGENVELGDRNWIGAYSVIEGPLVLGDDNWIGPHVVIGTPGQDTRNRYYDSTKQEIHIGNRNIIREFTAIQKPSYRDITKIGNDVFIMASVHIPHDAILHDNVVVTPMVVMGGIVEIFDGANLAIGCSVHQYAVVGHYSIVGMGSALSKNLKPFAKYIPGKPLSVNSYAVHKYGFSAVEHEISDYIYRNKMPTDHALLKIVMDFNIAHERSGKKLY